MQQCMNICKFVSLIMHLTCLSFKLSVLMVHLRLNYTTFDAWLAGLIFGLCKLLLQQGSQTSVRPLPSVNRWSSWSWLSSWDLFLQCLTGVLTACGVADSGNRRIWINTRLVSWNAERVDAVARQSTQLISKVNLGATESVSETLPPSISVCVRWGSE